MRASSYLVLVLASCSPGRDAAPSPAPPVDAVTVAPPIPAAAPVDPTAADASREALHAAILACALGDARVAEYIHPELENRVPVKVHAGSVAFGAPPVAFGAPVEFVDRERALVHVMAIEIEGSLSLARLEIPAEGVSVEIDCARDARVWRSRAASIAEH